MKLLSDIIGIIVMLLLIGAMGWAMVGVWNKKNRFRLDAFDKVLVTIMLTALILSTILTYVRTLT